MTIERWVTRLKIWPVIGIAALTTIALTASPLIAHAQDARARLLADLAQTVGMSVEGRVQATRTFGQSTASHTVGGVQFTGFEMSYPDLWDTNDAGSRSCAVPGCLLIAPLQLPSGAAITAIELNAFDANFGVDAKVTLRQTPINEGVTNVLATAQTEGVPGATFVTTLLPFPHTVDNAHNTYALVYAGADNNTTRVIAVRVLYHLQTSPAPAVATFSDVPTNHIFFPFVEALAASGITSGCGIGFFCPDQPVTRGQMAAFLSKALGLHFAP